MKVAFIPFCNEMKEFAWHHTASNWGRGEVCDTAMQVASVRPVLGTVPSCVCLPGGVSAQGEPRWCCHWDEAPRPGVSRGFPPFILPGS